MSQETTHDAEFFVDLSSASQQDVADAEVKPDALPAEKVDLPSSPALAGSCPGRVHYEGRYPDGYHKYRGVQPGTLWLFFTDCHGKVTSGLRFNIVVGHYYRVQPKCHAWGCR